MTGSTLRIVALLSLVLPTTHAYLAVTPSKIMNTRAFHSTTQMTMTSTTTTSTTSTRLYESKSHSDSDRPVRRGWKRAIFRVLPGKRTSKTTIMVATHSISETLPTPLWNMTQESSTVPYSKNYRTWNQVWIPPSTVPQVAKTTPIVTGSLVARMTKSYGEQFLKGLLHRKTVLPPQSLTVQVTPRNVVGRILRGHYKADAMATFGKMVFPNFQLSSGQLEVKRLKLNVLSFTPDLLRGRQHVNRYPSPFDLYFTNFTWTEQDLIESDCVRNGLCNLLLRILSSAGMRPGDIVISSITILPSGKLAISGQATTWKSKVPFVVRSFISTASRGHVVTFSGLEVSVALGVFMPMARMDVDIGHNARIDSIVLEEGSLTLTDRKSVV